MATICTECENLIRKEPPSSPRYNVWYNLLCAAVHREEIVDPMTGNKVFKTRNAFGDEVTTEDPYAFCRDVNKGNCPYFQPIEPDIDLNGSVWDELDV